MKIALILCPAWSREMPHLALALLSANLRQDGHRVFAFDLNNDFYHGCLQRYKDKWNKQEDYLWEDPSFVSEFISANADLINQSIKQILASNAQMIGFSVYFSTELMSLYLARRIKELDREKIIIFGGSQCLREIKGKILAKKEAVDAVVMGEGELTLLELVRMIDKNKKIDFCKGILFRNNGEIIDCGNRTPIMDLSSLPFSDFTDFTLSRYEFSHALPLLSSRSCVQRCVFCTVGNFWNNYRCMSGERIFHEMEQQMKIFNNVDEFHFYDPLINGDVKNLARFCDLVIENTNFGNFHSVHWRGEAIIRPEMTLEILKKIKEAGCFDLSFGIESGSQRVLDRMGKHFRLVDAQRIIRQAYDIGIRVTLNFMFGFPTETKADFDLTLDFIRRNAGYIDTILPSNSLCSIERGSILYRNAEQFGLEENPKHNLFWETKDKENTYPERLRRFEAFCELANSLGIRLGTDYIKIKNLREKLLQKYYEYEECKYKDRIDLKPGSREEMHEMALQKWIEKTR